MSESKTKLSDSDLRQDVNTNIIADSNMLHGHARAESALLVCHGNKFSATDAANTYYGTPLMDELLIDSTTLGTRTPVTPNQPTEVQIDYDLKKHDGKVGYLQDSKQLAAVVIHHDVRGSYKEIALEHAITTRLAKVFVPIANPTVPQYFYLRRS